MNPSVFTSFGVASRLAHLGPLGLVLVLALALTLVGIARRAPNWEGAPHRRRIDDAATSPAEPWLMPLYLTPTLGMWLLR